MRKMNEQEINQYMQELLNKRRKVENPLEQQALMQFQRITAESAQISQRLGALTAEVERLKIALQKSVGQREAYAQLLVAAEEARRPEAPTLSLEELRKKTGADKVQVVDKEGNVEAEARAPTEEEEATEPATEPEATQDDAQ
jgi:uncharacterized small protein (DUF1192 family)